ncbi:MAG: DinB family protein [Candidatus Eisenbacteria bacterium]
MTDTVRHRLPTSEGYRSAEIAGYVAQLDDLTRRMIVDLADITVEELGWQPIAGCNTIGMLLAHIAVVEVFWIQVAPLGRTTFDTKSVLGISLDDDGMPMPAGGAPPVVLAGHDRDWFATRLAEARRHTVEHLRGLGDDALTREFTRTRANGEVIEVDLRWVLYHVVEHLSGHYGQVLLLRHLYRDRARLGA